jgi:hypothetical protein
MELEQHLEQLIVDLDVAARTARNKVRDVSVRPVSTAADRVNHEKWLRDLLGHMSGVVDQTARGNGTAKERRLDLWPGYDSVLLSGSRITFEVDAGVRDMLSSVGYANSDSRAIQTGVSFPPLGNRTDRATLYFDAALAATPQRVPGDFSVGGTHNWLALGPNAGADPLIGFQVRTEKSVVASQRAFPAIDLDPARPLEWGDALAAAIAGICGDSAHSFWPLPAIRQGESRADYVLRLEREHASARHRKIRQNLYSLWLIGCFVPEPASILLEGKGRAWLNKLMADLKECDPERASRIEQLRSLEENVAFGGSSPFANVHFTTWGVVTIPYPIACTKSGENGAELDDLGSGMLLSNFDVPHWYYFVIRQWIASYYLSLRQHENSVLMAEREAHKAAMYAEQQLRRQLSHAVGTELTYIEFLASIAADSIKKEHFTPRPSVLTAGVTARSLADVSFAEEHGNPEPLEATLVDLIRNTKGHGQLERDVTMIEGALAAVPSERGRKVIAALANEVARVARENRALVRVDDAAVVANLERSDEPSRDLNAFRLVDLLNRALLVAFTVYFRKAFPPTLEGSEQVCVVSAQTLFGRSDESEAARRERGRDCAIAWREFIADAYGAEGHAPPYHVVQSWLYRELKARSRLRLQLPEPSDLGRVKPGCGEYAPLVIEAWLTEALLNALKHSRPSSLDSESIIKIDWVTGNAILEVGNTTTPENAAEVRRAVDSASRGGSSIKQGHQGLAFLGYAAKHLFTGSALHTDAAIGSDMLRLSIQ